MDCDQMTFDGNICWMWNSHDDPVNFVTMMPFDSLESFLLEQKHREYKVNKVETLRFVNIGYGLGVDLQ